jgi:hypothetical protein
LGKQKLDIRFWREGEQTEFDVTKGDPNLVERFNIANRIAQLRTGSDLAETPPAPGGNGTQQPLIARGSTLE